MYYTNEINSHTNLHTSLSFTENTYYKFVEDGGTYRLEIGTVWKQDEGSYKCKAENREGVTSTYGFLSVKGEKQLWV